MTSGIAKIKCAYMHCMNKFLILCIVNECDPILSVWIIILLTMKKTKRAGSLISLHITRLARSPYKTETYYSL